MSPHAHASADKVSAEAIAAATNMSGFRSAIPRIVVPPGYVPPSPKPPRAPAAAYNPQPLSITPRKAPHPNKLAMIMYRCRQWGDVCACVCTVRASALTPM